LIFQCFCLISFTFVAFRSACFWCETDAVLDTGEAGQRDIDRANCTVVSNPTLSASQIRGAVPPGREGSQNSAGFADIFVPENLRGRLQLLSMGAGERIFLRNLCTSSGSPTPNFLEATTRSGPVVSNPSPSTEIENCVRSLPPQPTFPAFSHPRGPGNGPEIRAFRAFDVISGLPICGS
jgi:hypothetical protein